MRPLPEAPPAVPFLRRLLKEPAHGYQRGDSVYVPSARELLREYFSRTNIFKSRKNWLPFLGVALLTISSAAYALFLTRFFSWSALAVSLFLVLVAMPMHQTLWYHRLCTHRAFKFRTKWGLFVLANAVPKCVEEELYVVSHHVHHAYADQPGDPYTPKGGFLYCLIAREIHQPISHDLDASDYAKAARMLTHVGMRVNSYAEYRRWGTLTRPADLIGHYLANWAVWYLLLYLCGGHGWALAAVGSYPIFTTVLKSFNYFGHGAGKPAWRDGIDFDRSSLAVNQGFYGWIAGEWHNNHHAYPRSARTGFLPGQPDVPFAIVRLLYRLGIVTSYIDSHEHSRRGRTFVAIEASAE